MSTIEDFEAKFDGLAVTKIVGDFSIQKYDQLIQELRPIATKVKTNLFPNGENYGFLAIISTDAEYRDYIEDPTYTFALPEKPSDYDYNIPDGIGETQRKLKEAQHKQRIIEYNKYVAATTCIRQIIVDAVPRQYIEALKDKVIGYDKVLPYDMLEHIAKSISLTTSDVDDMKATVFFPWDPTAETLRSFINRMEEGVKGCQRWKLEVPEADLMQHLVKQIYKNNVFEIKVMTDWENKRPVFKNWTYCKSYFIKESDNISNYSKVTAKQMGFHSAANVTEIEDATEESVNAVVDAISKTAEEMNLVATTNAGLEATVKEQSKQISKLIIMNENLVAMNENLVKALAAAGKEASDKDKATDAAKAAVEQAMKEAARKTGGGKEKKPCKYCKKKHKASDKYCLARKCNAHLRPEGWTGKEVDE